LNWEVILGEANLKYHLMGIDMFLEAIIDLGLPEPEQP